jgi:hypothetical protein
LLSNSFVHVFTQHSDLGEKFVWIPFSQFHLRLFLFLLGLVAASFAFQPIRRTLL